MSTASRATSAANLRPSLFGHSAPDAMMIPDNVERRVSFFETVYHHSDGNIPIPREQVRAPSQPFLPTLSSPEVVPEEREHGAAFPSQPELAPGNITDDSIQHSEWAVWRESSEEMEEMKSVAERGLQETKGDVKQSVREDCNQPLGNSEGSLPNRLDSSATGNDPGGRVIQCGIQAEPAPGLPFSPVSNCTDSSDSENDVIIEEKLRTALEVILFPAETTVPADIEKALSEIELSLFKNKEPQLKVLTPFLREVFRSMGDFKENGFLQIQACALIERIAFSSSPVQKAIGEMNGVKHILAALLTHKDSHLVQNKAINALLTITPDEKVRTQLTVQKGAECVSWAMTEFSDRREIVVNGSKTLTNIAFGSDEGKKRIGKVGGIDAIVTAMYVHSDDADLQANCCKALRNLTFGVPANQWIAGRACAMEAIVKSMGAFPKEEKVQYQGCIALENICSDEHENRSRATEIGVINACSALLSTHLKNASIAEHALALLRNICIGNTENQLQLGNCGFLQVILNALKIHKTNEGVLVSGCGALRYLFFAKLNRDWFCECRGLPSLLHVLRDGTEVASVSENALLALGNAVFDNSKSKKIVGRYGGIAAIVDIMSNHLDCESIQEYGCRALRNLADSDELNTRLLGESGAIDTAIFAMMGYPNNAVIQEQACAMLFNMAFSEANIQLMRHLEVGQVVHHVLAFHTQNLSIECQANALLQRINPVASKSMSGGAESGSRGASSSKQRKRSAVIDTRKGLETHLSGGGVGRQARQNKSSRR